jgi:hypothetical protein
MLTQSEYEPQLLGSQSTEFYEFLQRRLNWELPLLQGLSEAQPDLQVLIQALEQRNAEALRPALNRFQFWQRQLPRMVDIPILNELLILGAGPLDDLSPLRQRLPILLAWVQGLEQQWRDFSEFWTEEIALARHGLFAIRGLQGAAGGLFLALEQKDTDQLKRSLQLAVNSVQELAPLEASRHQLETAERELSPELRLERPWRQLNKNGRITPGQSEDLRRMIQEWRRELFERRAWVFVEQSDPPETVAALEDRAAELTRRQDAFESALRSGEALALLGELRQLELWRQVFQDS